MDFENLNCNNCGAQLEVPLAANFVKCKHCDSQLAVRRDASTSFTEVMDELSKTTKSLASEVAELRRQNELAELDRRWEIERRNYFVTGKHGEVEPNRASAILGGGVAAVFGVIFCLVGFTVFPPMAIFGAIFVFVAIWNIAHTTSRADALARAKSEYQKKRRAVGKSE